MFLPEEKHLESENAAGDDLEETAVESLRAFAVEETHILRAILVCYPLLFSSSLSKSLSVPVTYSTSN